jgi:hypothetical protein
MGNPVFKSAITGLLMVIALAGCTLNQPQPTPFPTPDLPRVRFLFPINNTQIAEGAEIQADIVAEDNSFGIAKIIFMVDGVQINEGMPEGDPVAVFRVSMNWVARAPGGHTLHAIAYRADGTPSTESIILVDVVSPIQ